MLTYRQLDDAGEAATKIISETEQAIINDMARRIARLDGVTTATNWQALRLELLGTEQKTILRELSRLLHISEQRVIELFDEAATRTLAADDKIYRAAGYAPVPLAKNLYMQHIIRAGLIKTLGEYQNLTLTTARTATRQFEQALDLAYHEIISGGMDYQTAIKNGIQTLTRNGIASITYPTGHVDYLDVAFRRATLTGINQTCGDVQLQRAQEMDTDIMEITAHAGARPDHAAWQGKLVSLSGQEGYLSVTDIGYKTVTGFKGANCKHDWFPFIEGVSEPAYTAEQLREYNNKKVKYNGAELSLYDASQRQRYFERQIRRWKREADALGAAGQDTGRAKMKVREWQATQRDFIKQTGLQRDYFRERAGAQFR